MKELEPRIHQNGIDYILVGDYYVPDLKLPEEHRPIGKWGRLHMAYLQQCSLIIEQMMKAEGVTEAMKAANQLLWVQSMNSIRNRAEEIIKHEMIYCDYAERSV